MKLINKNSAFFRPKTILVVFFVFFVFFALLPDLSQAEGGIQGTSLVPTETSKTSGLKLPGIYAFMTSPIDSTLLVILHFVGILLGIAETIFEWIIDPNIFTTLMNSPEIFKMWSFVRDLFNFLFIMTLLFSAFATVFQVEKYNYRKVVFHLVLMALLVNFSWPIARFIMDASNVVMYELANKIVAKTLVDSILSKSNVATLLAGGDTIFILSAIIFVFILAVSLLMIGLLLMIRVITLVIYLIFSPIGFIGSILPGTKFATVADEWWTDFMKHCFSGPIMLVMLYVANEMMIIVTNTNLSKEIKTSSSVNVPANVQGIITSAIISFIPVIIIWMGIIMAQKSGAIGADAVVGRGKKFLASVGKKVSGADWAKRNYGDYAAARKKRKDDANKTSIGKTFGSKANRLQDSLHTMSRLPGSKGARDRIVNEDAAKVKEATDDLDLANKGIPELRALVNSGNKHQSAAAIQELINKGSFDMSDPANSRNYQKMRDGFGTDSKTFNAINNKLKTSDPVSAFAHIDPSTRQARIAEFVNSNQFDAGKLGANTLGNDAFMRTAFTAGAINNDDLEKLRKKGPGHQRAITNSLGTLAGNADFNNFEQIQRDIAAVPAGAAGDQQRATLEAQLQAARNIQLAHVAQTGTFHASLDDNATDTPLQAADKVASRANVIGRLNADSGKRINNATVNTYYDELNTNLNNGKFKSIVDGMEDSSARQNLVVSARGERGGLNLHPIGSAARATWAAAQNPHAVGTPEYAAFDRNQRKAMTDPDLMWI